MTSIRIISVRGLWLTMLAFASATRPAGAVQAADSTSQGALGGTIFDRSTNLPVEGVRIRLTPNGSDARRQTTTDSAGRYQFTGLRLADYVLALDRLGYEALELDVLINRTAPVIVSIGIIPAPVPLPDVTVETTPPGPPPGTRGTPAIITRSNTIEAHEIVERRMVGLDAYALIRRLRPGWLTPRAETRIVAAANRIILYVDNVRRGTVDDLRAIDAGMVARVHFFDAIQATQQWGTGHVNGAIHVLLKPPGR